MNIINLSWDIQEKKFCHPLLSMYVCVHCWIELNGTLLNHFAIRWIHLNPEILRRCDHTYAFTASSILKHPFGTKFQVAKSSSPYFGVEVLIPKLHQHKIRQGILSERPPSLSIKMNLHLQTIVPIILVDCFSFLNFCPFLFLIHINQFTIQYEDFIHSIMESTSNMLSRKKPFVWFDKCDEFDEWKNLFWSIIGKCNKFKHTNERFESNLIKQSNNINSIFTQYLLLPKNSIESNTRQL